MPSGPGLERFCFHSKQWCSGCGRASEHRAVEPSDSQRAGKLADRQTKQAEKKPKTKQKLIHRRLWRGVFNCGQRAAAGPGLGSVDLGTALSCREAGGQRAPGRVRRPREWAKQVQPALCVPQVGHVAKEVKGGCRSLPSTPNYSLVLFTKQRNSVRTEEPGKFLSGDRETTPWFYTRDLM